MTLFIEEEGSEKLPLEEKETAKQMVEAVLEHENCPYEAEVELLLTNGEEIRLMNRDYRGIDRVTDVLSFPMLEFGTPSDFSHVEDMDDVFHPESGELMLGNIVICKERVLDQAREYGHSVKREYAFLIVHSMLHLLGYDHMNEHDRLVMEEKQREIMRKTGIAR